jgi:hypothetical protein
MNFPLASFEGGEITNPYLLNEADAALLNRMYLWLCAFAEERYGAPMPRPSGSYLELHLLLSQFQAARQAYYGSEHASRQRICRAIDARFEALCPPPPTPLDAEANTKAASAEADKIDLEMRCPEDDDELRAWHDRAVHARVQAGLPFTGLFKLGSGRRKRLDFMAAFERSDSAAVPWNPTHVEPHVW